MVNSMAKVQLDAWGNQMLLEHNLQLVELKQMSVDEVAAMVRNLVLDPSDCYDSKALEEAKSSWVTGNGSRDLRIEGGFEDKDIVAFTSGVMGDGYYWYDLRTIPVERMIWVFEYQDTGIEIWRGFYKETEDRWLMRSYKE
jgi:hypothetical protein